MPQIAKSQAFEDEKSDNFNAMHKCRAIKQYYERKCATLSRQICRNPVFQHFVVAACRNTDAGNHGSSRPSRPAPEMRH